ncbi:MAG: tRNA lysidine(34) synthetase TilS [Gemmatimonadota bacterium]
MSTVVVAVSGGLDSCALLHMLRFPGAGAVVPMLREGAFQPSRLVAAHFDHRMRPGSNADARWLRGLCAAWGVDLVTGVASEPPTSEAEARAARYGFLREVRRDLGARTIATAHHKDDQAETVLFRMFRGTGPAGLQGIEAERADGVWRPLLGVWRQDILDYARTVGLRWREDPTNVALGFARNALRHRVIPDAERLVAPGAKRALVRFAERAAHDEAGWESLIPRLLDSLDPEWRPEGVTVDRAGLLAFHPAVRARILRTLALELGFRPGSGVTALAVDFAESAGSGRTIDLGRSFVLRRDLDRLTLERRRTGSPTEDRPLLIHEPASGSGEVVLAGRSIWVGWGAAAGTRPGVVERFRPDELRFPLTVRGWEDGDRIRTSAGRRKLKRVFLEARIPAAERRRVPVLADAEGVVLWIPGVQRAPRPPGEAPARDVLPIGVG